MTFLDKIVTPKFVAFQAHCWFAYALVFTFPVMLWYVIAGAAVKEFYVDKHYESHQTFRDDLEDWGGYCSGVVLAVAARHFL